MIHHLTLNQWILKHFILTDFNWLQKITKCYLFATKIRKPLLVWLSWTHRIQFICFYLLLFILCIGFCMIICCPVAKPVHFIVINLFALHLIYAEHVCCIIFFLSEALLITYSLGWVHGFLSKFLCLGRNANKKDNQCSNMHETLANLKRDVLCLPQCWNCDLVDILYWQMELRGQLTGR